MKHILKPMPMGSGWSSGAARMALQALWHRPDQRRLTYVSQVRHTSGHRSLWCMCASRMREADGDRWRLTVGRAEEEGVEEEGAREEEEERDEEVGRWRLAGTDERVSREDDEDERKGVSSEEEEEEMEREEG